jgi:hypothetical protein
MNKNDSTTTNKRGMGRRSFLRRSAAAAGAVLGAPAIVRAQNLNDLLNIAIIGCGGRGAGNLQGVHQENIVALCDVNQQNLDQIAVHFPKAEKFSDFRKLYDKPELFDAVVVSTCEHTHAFATLPALKLGKHVYCEKPLTHNIWEARIVREAANKAKVATQMGTQIHAQDNYRRVVELIQAGSIGPVREVHVWVGRAWGWQATEEEAKANEDILFTNERPTTADPIPPGLDWDLWLGPAPERPFNNIYVPGPKWYRWWDWGSGTMSDLGSHWIDLPFWALNLKYPLTVEAFGPAGPPRPRAGDDARGVRVRPARRHAGPQVDLVPGQGEAPALVGRLHPPVGQRRSLHRRQGHGPGRLRPAHAAAGGPSSRTSPRRHKRFRNRWAITSSGSTPARPANRRPATSSIPGG